MADLPPKDPSVTAASVIPTAEAAPSPAPAAAAPTPAAAESVPVAVEAKAADANASILSAAAETLKADEPAKAVDGNEKPADPAKADEAKPAEAAKPEAEAKAPEPAPPLTYTDLKFPEGTTINETELKPYTDIFGKHQIPQAAVQELIDLHAKELATQTQRQATLQRETWSNLRKGWVDEFVADPDIGGKVRETSLARAAGVIERYGGSAEQQQSLRDTFTLTGAGDHPSVIRLLANVGKALGEGRIVPAVRTKAASSKSSPKSRYNSSNGAS